MKESFIFKNFNVNSNLLHLRSIPPYLVHKSFFHFCKININNHYKNKLLKGTSHTLSLNMYVTLHNPNFSVLKYLTCFLSFPSSLIWPLCLSWLISVINKPQPSLYSGRHLNSRDTCLGPKDVPWIEVPLYSYLNIVLYIHICSLINYCIIYTCMFTDQYCTKYREYFMESAGIRYLRTSCWRIRNRTSERSERVRFLIQKQRVRKYRTKHFPCGIVFIIYILRHS